MSRELLNEAERFVLKQWDDARLLEESMEAVRKKYGELWERICETVQGAHPELDLCKARVTQRWDKGFCVVTRKVWPGTVDETWPSGFWMYSLRLEKLAAEDSGPPTASIWIPPKIYKQIGLDAQTAREKLLSTARQVLSGVELTEVLAANEDPPSETLLAFSPPTKSDILTGFVDGDGQRLVDMIVAKFDLMARFVPALDQLFGVGKTTASTGAK